MTESIKSLDTFSVEVSEINGCDYVKIFRGRERPEKPDIVFLKGDSAPASCFLSTLSELFGVGLITLKPGRHK